MQIKVESLNSVRKKINFEIPAEQVTAEVNKAYAEIRKHAAIKGFRKGKVPMGLIQKNYADKMAEDVLKNLVNDTYFKAIGDQGLNPVGYPVIESDRLTPGEPFTFSATVEVYPEVTLTEYLGLELVREQLVEDDAALAGRLKEMQENLSQQVPAPGGHLAAMGDFVTFDFLGTLDGVPFEGGEAEGFQLELGSGRFIPGFEEQLVGMGVDASGTVKVSFPENYGNKDLAGKPAEFAVTVREIKIKELPELNDEFAKEFGEFETLDELKVKLAEFQKAQEERRIEQELHDRLLKALIAKNELEIPETFVDRQVGSMLESTKQRLASQRLSLEMVGLTEDGYKIQFREQAREQVKGSILLDAIAEKESLAASEEDIAARVQEIATATRQDPEKVAGHYLPNSQGRANLVVQILEDKAIEFVLANAKVVELPKDQINN